MTGKSWQGHQETEDWLIEVTRRGDPPEKVPIPYEMFLRLIIRNDEAQGATTMTVAVQRLLALVDELASLTAWDVAELEETRVAIRQESALPRVRRRTSSRPDPRYSDTSDASAG